MRDCWTGSIGPLLAQTQPVTAHVPDPERRAIGFVPVDDLVTAGFLAEPAEPTAAEPTAAKPTATEPTPPAAELRRPDSLGWTLWGDAYL